MVISKEELRQIKLKLLKSFNKEERERLNKQSEFLYKLAKNLKNRPFLQAMSGSSTKKLNDQNKTRNFKVYELIKIEQGMKLKADNYEWVDYEFQYTNSEDVLFNSDIERKYGLGN